MPVSACSVCHRPIERSASPLLAIGPVCLRKLVGQRQQSRPRVQPAVEVSQADPRQLRLVLDEAAERVACTQP